MQNIGAQGELRVYKIAELPANVGKTRPKKDAAGNFILAHSEKGHHHVLPSAGVDVIEHIEEKMVGKQKMALRTLYAIVTEPTALHQTALHNHADLHLDPGIYAIRADVEFDPFADKLAEVRD